MVREFKYRAFISYSHVDRRWARWLHRVVETYRVPRRLVGTRSVAGLIPARLSPVFRDRDELASSPDLSDRINEALENSQNLIVVCSPSAASSRWVNQEIETFKRLGRSDRVFALIVDGDPAQTIEAVDCFPPAMRLQFDASGKPVSGQAEPIGADVRKTGDGRSLARLKIIAGMLGVGLDDLRRRELLRKQRRMAVITIASLAALAFTVVLALNAYFARNEANQRRSQAEELLSFMVGDLRDSLEPIGRLDLLEKVGESAMRYFSTVDIDALTDQELLRHAQVLTQLGEIRVSQMEYDGALDSFAEAFERSAALYRNNESEGDRLFDRSQAEFWVGYVHWRRGNLDDAREWLIRYLVSAQELSRLDPSRDDWTMEIAYGYHNLAVLAMESGHHDEAKDGFNNELKILYALQQGAGNDGLNRDIADAVSWLGKIGLMQGELATALGNYERSAQALELLSKSDPDDRHRQYDWAHGMLLIAEVSAIVGDLERALDYAGRAESVFDLLVAHDSANKEWQLSSSNAAIAKGNIHAARGEWGGARLQAERSIAVLEEIVASGVADLSVRSHLVDAYHLYSWVQQAGGDPTAALESNQAALDGLRWIEQANRLNDEHVGLLASVHVVRGQLLASAGNATAAEKAWHEAADLIQLKAATTRTHRLIDPWVRVLMLSGEGDKATELRAELDSNGYRPLRPWPR